LRGADVTFAVNQAFQTHLVLTNPSGLQQNRQIAVDETLQKASVLKNALQAHDAVADVFVVPSCNPSQLTAYVVPHWEGMLAEPGNQLPSLLAEQIGLWERIFDHTYLQSAPIADPQLNFSVWKSRYTNEPIAVESMQEWVHTVVQRIAGLKPKSVLEIGCGTGLLLFPLLDQVDEYVGTDISEAGVNYLNVQLAKLNRKQPSVEIFRAAAIDFEQLQHRSFDLVLLNSIIQYFPNPDYLNAVLSGAISVTKDGGAIFIGDVRSLHLLEVFSAAISSYQAPDNLSLCRLRELAIKAIAEEKELLVDPHFFYQLSKTLTRISSVEIKLKRGRAKTEMLQFRYDVVIHIGDPKSVTACEWIPYSPEKFSLALIDDLLSEGQAERIGFTSVPNARLNEANLWNQALSSNTHQPDSTIGELRKTLAGFASVAFDPEDLWQLAESHCYEADITWALEDPSGSFNVLFRKGAEYAVPPDVERAQSSFERTERQAAVNNPLLWKYSRQLTPKLKQFLKREAPEFTDLGDLILVERLPSYLKSVLMQFDDESITVET
jgi:ubiquinone/menaquinone biosynthesis C-methylase UbiE